MQNFHDLLEHVLTDGDRKANRTDVATLSSIGHALKYDLTGGKLAALTTKKLAFESAKGELVGFLRGCSNAADFRALNCKVWDQNANETPSWLNNKHRKGTDDLGRIYGVQWTAWRDTRYARSEAEAQALETAGYALMAHDQARGMWVFERTINQLEEALRLLLRDPNNRRIIISGWRVDELDQMALPPCHVCYWLGVDGKNRLHSTLWIRSNDLFLGHPFNAVSLSLFTHLMARLSGREAASATVFISDAHVYENHLEQTKELLTREHFPAPTIAFSDRLQPVKDEAEIAGVFERIEPSDLWMEGYQSHGALTAPMAA